MPQQTLVKPIQKAPDSVKEPGASAILRLAEPYLFTWNFVLPVAK